MYPTSYFSQQAWLQERWKTNLAQIPAKPSEREFNQPFVGTDYVQAFSPPLLPAAQQEFSVLNFSLVGSDQFTFYYGALVCILFLPVRNLRMTENWRYFLSIFLPAFTFFSFQGIIYLDCPYRPNFLLVDKIQRAFFFPPDVIIFSSGDG